MTAKEKYIKDNRLGRLSKKQKDLIFAYEPWLSLDTCVVSALYQITRNYENDIYSEIAEYARQNTHLIYSDPTDVGAGLESIPKHIGTVVDLRGWQDFVERENN